MRLGWVPRNGWRNFAGEVGVIVLGVLIALAAQQAVEELDRASNRTFTEAALDGDLTDLVVNATERLMIAPCLKARLTELDLKLAEQTPQWRGNPQRMGATLYASTAALAEVYRVPSRLWSTAAWQTAVANGVLTTMNRATVSQLANLFSQITTISERAEAEQAAAPALTFLSHDQQLTSADRIAAQKTLAELDRDNDLIVLIASQLLDQVRGLRRNLDHARIAADVAEVYRRQRRYRGPCVRNLRINL